MSDWTQVLAAIAVMIAPEAIARAEDLAYVNYWNLTTTSPPVELNLDQKAPVTSQYLPGEITPSQPVPAGQHAIWLNRPRQQLATVQMQAGQFYTVVLLQQATLKGIVLNDKLARSEPTLRLVNLTTGNVQVNIPTMAPLEIKPGEQQDVPVTVTNDSAVGLVTVNARSRSGPTDSTQGTFGVGPDHASVLLIDQSGSGLRLTRWQYDQCAVRIATFDYEDACGHSD